MFLKTVGAHHILGARIKRSSPSSRITLIKVAKLAWCLYCATLLITELGYSKASSIFLPMIRSELPHILLTTDMITFVAPSDQIQLPSFVRHGSNSPISFMTHWKVLFCHDPICSLCPINSIPQSARASYEIKNILVLSNHQTVTAPKMRT